MEALYYGATDIGRLRTNNEDTFIAQQILDDQHLLFAVIDGMGGYAGGEASAEIARDTIIKFLEDFPNGNCLEQLKLAVLNANNEIMRYKEVVPKYNHMGCVLTAVLIELDNSIINVVHIGDTRLYQYHNGQIQKLTHDHSYVGSLEEKGELTEEEAMHHPYRNYIFRFLGDAPHTFDDLKFMDAAITPVCQSSQLLLCSDGLYDMVTSSEMCQILQFAKNPNEKVKMLISKANENGGKDNITAIIVELGQTNTKGINIMGTSKKLSYLLRHSDVPDEQGWISVEDLVSRFGYTEQGLKQIVANDEKKRYEFSEGLKSVRALYGHSNHVHIQWDITEPPAILYHGTAKRFLESILKNGLKRMDRNYVHLSETIEEAIQVGKRHGEPAVLAIDTKMVIQNGGCFYRVPNGIWLTECVDSQYITISSVS